MNESQSHFVHGFKFNSIEQNHCRSGLGWELHLATESGRRSRLAKAMRLRSRALNDGGLYSDGQEEAWLLEASRARHADRAAPKNCDQG